MSMNRAAAEPGSMVAYRPLLHLEARCEYFADGLCRDLKFSLAPASAALARSRNLLLRETAAGITVYGASRGERADQSAANEELTLTIKVMPRDAGFANYADLDGRQMESVFRFDSTRAVANAQDGTLRLHAEPWAAAADRIPVTAPELAAVLDARERLAPPLAVINLHLNTREVGGVRTYYIAFRARRTLWKYYVLGAAQTDAPLAIRDADGAIEFAAPAESSQSFGDNRRAVTLLSNSPIALQERPNYRFQLRANTPGGGKVLVRRLAVASPHQLAKEIVNGREVAVSEIYINL